MRLRFTLPVLFALAPVSAGLAQSYDCARASTPTEETVCKHRDLANLDVEMATLYGVVQKLPMMMGSRGAQTDAAHDFLTKRDACGADTSCLKSAYDARISALKSTIDSAMSDYCKAIQLC